MYDHNNIRICLYNGYSCGKFLSNILSYNKNFIPQFPLDGNRYKFYSKETYDSFSLEELQDIKHDSIMTTVPPQDQTKDWTEYELGCNGFWGFWSGDIDKPINNKALWLINQGVNCFFVAHNIIQHRAAKQKFPNAKTIRLINDKRVNTLSRDLKLPDNQRNYSGWVDLSTCQIDCVDFDIDSMFDESKFFDNVNQLLIDLNVADKNLDPRVYEYYRIYCDLYKNLLN